MKYITYFLYILEHKWNVFKCCWKRGLYLHAFTHDLSKFLPDEFFPYANWFYSKKIKKLKNERYVNEIIIKCKNSFDKAWKKHYTRNKHHWNNWDFKTTERKEITRKEYNWGDYNYNGKYYRGYVVYNMPKKYILQMICDWEAMGLKFGDTAKEYYQKNKEKILLHPESRQILESILYYK